MTRDAEGQTTPDQRKLVTQQAGPVDKRRQMRLTVAIRTAIRLPPMDDAAPGRRVRKGRNY